MLLFLDYDGTLAPIVNDPERAFMSEEMRAAVSALASLVPTSIISGRALDRLQNFVRLDNVCYAGSHGLDIRGAREGPQRLRELIGEDGVRFQPALEFVGVMNTVHDELVAGLEGIEGAGVEHNTFCVSAHYRNVPQERWGEVEAVVEEAVGRHPQLRLGRGKKVLEVRPVLQWDKGDAVAFLVQSMGLQAPGEIFPIYIGDDTTDEDAFRQIGEWGAGAGILVSDRERETLAGHTLANPGQVLAFLQGLSDWAQREKAGWLAPLGPPRASAGGRGGGRKEGSLEPPGLGSWRATRRTALHSTIAHLLS